MSSLAIRSTTLLSNKQSQKMSLKTRAWGSFDLRKASIKLNFNPLFARTNIWISHSARWDYPRIITKFSSRRSRSPKKWAPRKPQSLPTWSHLHSQYHKLGPKCTLSSRWKLTQTTKMRMLPFCCRLPRCTILASAVLNSLLVRARPNSSHSSTKIFREFFLKKCKMAAT